ncbi:MAG: ABC transporter substrate-binding protein [Elusimicrobia bacterium]|nr:ABC transporter substrate-binding protein [Elusimicrobiota bacterium]
MIKTALALLLAAAPAFSAVKNPDTLVVLNAVEPNSVDPANAYNLQSRGLLANVCEYLVTTVEGAAPALAPGLATSVPSRENGQISADGRSYRFHLRRGVRFHDGSLMSPEDVKYSLLRFLLLDRDNGPSQELLQPILGLNSTRDAAGVLRPDVFRRADQAIRVEGNDLVVTLERPYAPFLALLARFGAVLAKKGTVAQNDWDGRGETLARYNNRKREDSPLRFGVDCTGPFRVERWDATDRAIHLVRHDGYWRGPARLKRVVIKTVEDFNVRRLSLGAGDADVIYAESAQRTLLKDMEGVQVLDNLPLIGFEEVVAFNLAISTAGNPFSGSGRLDGEGIPPDFFKDPDVRKAVASLIDYDGFVRDVMGGGRRARGPVPRGLPGFDPEQAGYSYDPARAGEHLKKAWGGRLWEKGFRFTFHYSSGKAKDQVVALMIQRGLERLNPKFHVDIRAVQIGTSIEFYATKKATLLLDVAQFTTLDPHPLFHGMMHSSYAGKVTGYVSPEADRLIEAAVAAGDPKERERLYRRLQRLWYEDIPQIPVAEAAGVRVQRSWVKGYVFNPTLPGAPSMSLFRDLRKE